MRKLILILICFFSFNLNIWALEEAPVSVLDKSIMELQEYVKKGYLDYETIVKIYLDRIEAYDKDYNSIISINENAIEEAILKDQNYNAEVGLLYGIPVLVKDNIDVAELPTTGGTKSLSDSYPLDDAFVIKKLKEAGAIILGKTNMSELAFTANTSRSSYGTVKNSFNTEYSAYGSSGGSAVAVSLGFASYALGTDTNSSVRVPASASNLVGLRPSLGLVSRTGVIPYDINRDTVGTITKYAADAKIILNTISEFDETDFLSETKSSENIDDENILNGLNIGVISSFLEGSSDVVKNLFNESIEKLKSAGANIIYMDNFYTSEMTSLKNTMSAGYTMCVNFNDYIKNKTGTIKSFSELSKSKGHIYTLSNYTKYCDINDDYREKLSSKRDKFKNLVTDKMDSFDAAIIMYPSTSSRLIKLNEIEDGIYKSYSYYISPNSGMPAVSVPMGFYDALPYGIEFLSGKFTEDFLLNVADSYQNINNTVKTPDAVPDLYIISDSVKELVSNYEEIYEKKGYEEITLKVKDYFKNYSKDDNKEENALNLINEIKSFKPKNNLIIVGKESNINYTRVYVFIGFITVLLILNLINRAKLLNIDKRIFVKNNKLIKKYGINGVRLNNFDGALNLRSNDYIKKYLIQNYVIYKISFNVVNNKIKENRLFIKKISQNYEIDKKTIDFSKNTSKRYKAGEKFDINLNLIYRCNYIMWLYGLITKEDIFTNIELTNIEDKALSKLEIIEFNDLVYKINKTFDYYNYKNKVHPFKYKEEAYREIKRAIEDIFK